MILAGSANLTSQCLRTHPVPLSPAITFAPTNGDTFPTPQVKNLEERIKVEQLKVALEEIFSEFGNVLEIIAKTNLKAKGQAFIVFDSVDAATRAIDEVNGFELFDKPMVLDYAKTKSDATVLREGGSEELEAHKRKRLAEKGGLQRLIRFHREDCVRNMSC
jgi:hypothetical protein